MHGETHIKILFVIFKADVEKMQICIGKANLYIAGEVSRRYW